MQSLRTRFKNEVLKTDDALLAVKEKLDRNAELILEKSDEVNNLESKVRLLQEQYEAEKQVCYIAYRTTCIYIGVTLKDNNS